MANLGLEQGDTTLPIRLDLQRSESYTGRNNHHSHITDTKTHHGEEGQGKTEGLGPHPDTLDLQAFEFLQV